MSPKYFSSILMLGTQGVSDPQLKKGIFITNSLALATAILACVIGTAFSFVTRNWMIFIPALLECIGFFAVLFINKHKKYEAAGLTLLILHCIWAVYFGAIFGIMIEIRLIILFLISATLLIYKRKKPLIICITAAAFSLVIMEVNYFLGIVKPVPLSHNVQFLLRWLCILSILFLNIMVILFYKKSNTELFNALLQHSNNLEDLVQQRTAELEEANMSKRVFLQQTSHEIRNPLNAIFGIAQIMRLNLKNGIQQDLSLIEPLYFASFNTREIVNNVLELSRIEAGRLYEIEKSCFLIRPCIIDIICVQRYVALAKSVSLQYEFDQRLPEAIIEDKIKLGEIVSNLLSNAIKFTRPDSTINIRIALQGSKWQLSVTDQGPGIEENRLKNIFDAFVSQRSSFVAGTGLGLHIAKHFVELMDGTITVDSNIGKGTTFTVTFPLTEGDRSHATNDDELILLSSFSDRSVLVVDDDSMSRAIISHFLSNAGLKVQTVGNGMDGLRVARTLPPDLIILDAHLPVMDGAEILKELKGDVMLRHVPVIIVSGDAFIETSRQFEGMGAADYISKPIDYNQFCHVVGKYLALETKRPAGAGL